MRWDYLNKPTRKFEFNERVGEMSTIIDKIENSPYGISISLLIRLFQINKEIKKMIKCQKKFKE